VKNWFQRFAFKWVNVYRYVTVYDKDTTTQDDFLAQYCCPVRALRSGTRVLPLYNEEGRYVGTSGDTLRQSSCLVVKFS
jgi:hypothetical protein